ncbi:MAG: Homoserine O-acetyltransferase [uncultured Chthoniobacterales bacterium]|uniref:Homoserine O-acetyltransferase n=1 Tax=uncultured Chthoniobacterales bacterium TaxID=1836801 RepID=A0A6J4HZB8_9BACT|nr:MAG: Homoserine O-acetyltransferase [uncultured Chthoniobacterales bacterium]
MKTCHTAHWKIMRSMAFLLMLVGSLASAAEYPAPIEGDFSLRNFRFASGETMPELRIHYRTIGEPRKDEQGKVRNAVLITHGTTGSGAQFIRPEFAGELFGPGQLLDATKFFIVLPDGIGHGKSSKPSDGSHAKFPRYGYRDMVDAQFRLLKEGLGVDHARLVMGTSMGGMHTWLWGQMHPEFMDALMPLASLPTQISGRNRAWRRMVIDAIRSDPEWQGGDYTNQPQSLRTGAQMLWLMSSNPVLRQQQAPTREKADEELDKFVADYLKTGDANDMLYALEASYDYDPAPGLEKIRAPLVAVNFADDLINPPELGIFEREIKRVPNGRAVTLPLSDKTRGHGSHTLAVLWKAELEQLLKLSERK